MKKFKTITTRKKLGLLVAAVLIIFWLVKFSPLSPYLFSSSETIIGQFEFPFIEKVSEPYLTAIVDPPTVVATPVLSPVAVSKDKDSRPASAILQLTDELKVANADDEDLIDVLQAMKNKTIPIFWIEDVHVANAFIDFYHDEKHRLLDGMVMSENPAILKLLRVNTKFLPGILKIDGREAFTPEKRNEAKATLIANLGRLLYVSNSSEVTKDDVRALQAHGISVWLDTPLNVSLYEQLMKAPNGLVTANTAGVYELFETFSGPLPILLRTPFNVAHRGLPSLAPQNTIESGELAFSKGADCLELDIMMTKDEVLVSFHDDRVGQLTGHKDNPYIWDLTWEEVSRLVPNQPGSYAHSVTWKASDYPDVRIPTIRECFQRFKDPTGKQLIFAEIKEMNPERYDKVIAKLKDLMDEFEMHDQIILIQFNPTLYTLEKNQWYLPHASVGGLTRSKADVKTLLREFTASHMFINGKINANLTAQGVKALNHRGLPYAAWTYRFTDQRATFKLLTHSTNRNNIKRDYLKGVFAMTNSNADQLAKVPVALTFAQTSLDLKLGEVFFPETTAYNRLGEEKLAKLSLAYILEGHDVVQLSEQGKLTALKPGKAVVVYSAENQLLDQKFLLLSEPITIQVHPS